MSTPMTEETFEVKVLLKLTYPTGEDPIEIINDMDYHFTSDEAEIKDTEIIAAEEFVL